MGYSYINLDQMNGLIQKMRGLHDRLPFIKGGLQDMLDQAGATASLGQFDSAVTWAEEKMLDLQKRYDLGVLAAGATTNLGNVTIDESLVPIISPEDLPKPDWGPDQVAGWWAGLTDAQKQALITSMPDVIGNLDGVDMASRGQANELRLPGLITDAATKVAEAQAALAAAQTAATEASSKVGRGASSASKESAVAAMEANEKVTAAQDALAKAQANYEDLTTLQAMETHGITSQIPGAQSDPCMIVALDASGYPVKAAVAVGDVDHAKNVVVMTPGMTSTVRGAMPGYAEQADNICQLGAEETGSADTAAIVWLGYDAPDNLAQAASPSVAEAAAPHLASFLDGFQASRIQPGAGGDPNLTAFGHSYGSTVTGIAATLTQPGTIDNLIITGSPGSGVTNTSQYQVPPGRIFNSSAQPRLVVDEHGHVLVAQDGAVGLGQNASIIAGATGPVFGIIAHEITKGFGGDPKHMPGFTQLSNQTGPPVAPGNPSSEILQYFEKEVAGLHLTYTYVDGNGNPCPAMQDIVNVVTGQR